MAVASQTIGGDLRLALDRVAFAEELGIVPDGWQRDLLRSTANRTLLNCCRQSGKSTMSAIIALHRALYHPGSLVLCLAPALRQSQELFAKVIGFYRDLGRPVPPTAEQRLGLELSNGSRIVTLPGSERTIRGFSAVDLLIVDEAARVEDELYHAIRPMLSVSGGRLMMLSTPNGCIGAFYEAWEYEQDQGWERFRVPATECPRFTPEFLEAERKAQGQWWFAQEFMCVFQEAGGQAFAESWIKSAFQDELVEDEYKGEEELWS
jgi:hypothetical protein